MATTRLVDLDQLVAPRSAAEVITEVEEVTLAATREVVTKDLRALHMTKSEQHLKLCLPSEEALILRQRPSRLSHI